jgi:hypothetical protein
MSNRNWLHVASLEWRDYTVSDDGSVEDCSAADRALSAKFERVAQIVLKPVIGARQYRVPFSEAVAISKEADQVRAADTFVLVSIRRLVARVPIGDDALSAIYNWTERQFHQLTRQEGRPLDTDTRLALYVSYRQKLEATPNRKREAIISELETEFGLERRRIFSIIRELKQYESNPKFVELLQPFIKP